MAFPFGAEAQTISPKRIREFDLDQKTPEGVALAVFDVRLGS
jgi:hypothetical protein